MANAIWFNFVFVTINMCYEIFLYTLAPAPAVNRL